MFNLVCRIFGQGDTFKINDGQYRRCRCVCNFENFANKLAPSSRPGWVPGTSGEVEEREGGCDRQRGTRPI